MKVTFKKDKLKKLCECYEDLKKEYGPIQAKTIVMRIEGLRSAVSLHDVGQVRQMRLHRLGGNLKELWSIDIKHPYRIFIRPAGEDFSDLKTVKEVEIVAVHKDPH
jgi:plasmid maintenance system killer protein